MHQIKILLWSVIFFFPFLLLSQPGCTLETNCGSLPVSGGLGGETFFCVGETVNFQNDTEAALVDTTIMDWGDGVRDTFTNQLLYQHVYTFPEDTCLISSPALTFQITMTVINSCDVDQRSVNCLISFVQIKVKPVAEFEVPSQHCVGEEICFTNLSCDNSNDATYEWNFAGLDSSDEENPCFTFPAPGQYPVTLTVTNECGSDTYVQNVSILEPAINNGIIADGQLHDGIYEICLDTNPVICLDGDSLSVNESSYFWDVLQSGGSVFILPDPFTSPVLPELKLEFTAPGIYDVVLEVNNVCGQAAFDTLTVEVFTGDISLDPQEDGCISLDYTPSPLNEQLIYTVNNVVEGDFPLTLGPGTYFIEGNLASSVCPATPVFDTIVVLSQGTGMIVTPDTTICTLDGPFTFEATPENGEWMIDGVLFDGVLDPGPYAAGTYTITYGNEPCISTDTVLITLIRAEIDMPEDVELCIDGDPEQFVASPPFGDWSAGGGASITPDGIFDPSSVPAGVYPFYYEVVNPEYPSCSNIDSFMVTVTDLAVDFQVTDCQGTNLCFEIITDDPFTTATWDFGGLGNSNSLTPCFTFPAAQSYDVTVTISNGTCSVSITKTITIADPPVANMSLSFDPNLCAPLTVTFNNNSTGSNLNYSWLRNGVEFSTEAVPDPETLEPLTVETSYEFTLIITNDCDTDMQSQTIIVKPRPISIFGTTQNQYCSGDTIPISNTSTGNPTSYEWLLNGSSISQDSVPPIIDYFTDIVDTIEICLVTMNDCGTDTLCVLVEVIPTDVFAFFHTDPTVVCVGDSIQFTNFATTGVPVLYYFGDGNSTSNPNPIYSYAQAGEYLVVQYAFGCGVDTFDMLITVEEGPVSTWNSPAFGCPGDVLFFENTSTDVTQFEWDFGDGTAVSSEESPMHSFSDPGFYEVCLTVSSSAVQTCSNTLCQTVEIFIPPAGGFMVTDSLCLNDITLFTSTADCSTLSYDYLFGYEDNASEDCNPSHQYAYAGTFLVTQIVTDNNQCQDTVQQQVFVRPLPEPSFTFESMIGCHPDSVVFTNLSQNATSYFWDFGDNSGSTDTHPTHYYQNPGTFQVTLTAIIDGICSAEMMLEVTIDETPIAAFVSNQAAICAGLEMGFTSTSTGTITQHEWDFGDGFFSFVPNPSHTFQTPGIYEVELIVSNETFCADTTTIEITVHESLAVQNSVSDLVCFEDNLGEINLDIVAGTAPYNFNWSNGEESEDIDMLSAGIYDVTVTDDNGCQWIESYTISQPPEIQLDWLEQIVTCSGGNDGSLEITISGGTEPYEIAWENGENTSTIDNLFAGNYAVTITDANGCERLSDIPVGENSPIQVLDSISHISCFGAHDGVIALDSVYGGVGPYFMEVVSNNFMSSGVNITRFDSLGAATYAIQIEDTNGCLFFSEEEIIEPDSIFVNIEKDTITVDLGASAVINTFYNANEPEFYWSPPKWLDCVDCPEPLTTPHQNEQYFLEMRDKNGCLAGDSIVVLVKPNREVYIPNTFTPNNDLLNDIFRIRSHYPLSIEEVQVFQIFDRWGETLFERQHFQPNDRTYGWDGTFKGKEVEPGVYVYFAEIEYVDGIVLQFKGEILLIRD